jgi:hypothetical protein
MSKTRVIALLATLLGGLVLMSPSRAMHSDQYAVEWSAVGTGGWPMGSSQFDLDSTAGQAATGSSESPGYALCAGYWCGAAVEYEVHLPLILRDA